MVMNTNVGHDLGENKVYFLLARDFCLFAVIYFAFFLFARSFAMMMRVDLNALSLSTITSI